MRSLLETIPQVSAAHIIEGFTPPQRFAHVRFENYVPNSDELSQSQALLICREFVTPQQKRKLFGGTAQFFDSKPGLYLDGGFGVGKTHLLASMWHHANSAGLGKCGYASFVEVTNAVGLLGFQKTVDALSEFALVCIDEFELDDPGDTVLMSSLLQALVDRGVRFAVTSNTLPDKLGEGRFAADDFIREIQGLRAHFEIIRIDGPDFRRIDRPDEATIEPLTEEAFDVLHATHASKNMASDNFDSLNEHLVRVHPSAYGELVADLDGLLIADVHQLDNQAHALRWVAFIDKIYDREVPVRATGIAWRNIFTSEMLRGGYRKKYLRALSRIESLAQSEI